ncbi:MAG TPA: DUF1385 domain-containing protein [Chloroflexota bacterium]|nr:DUF1385 domain-containing protein [Chloroflexota bacterium]
MVTYGIMTQASPTPIRVGGSALPDGVMMLTPLAAAIARESADGTLTIESFPLPPRKSHPVERLPFIRIVPKLVSQMGLVVRGWKPSRGKRIPLPLLAAIICIGILSTLANGVFATLPAVWHAAGSSILQLLLFFSLIGVTRALPRFGRIWRFHGGEHQAIAAYEAGMPLTVENTRKRTLYHPRCGTNLAMLAMLLMVPGMVLGSVISGYAGYVITVAVPLPALCIAFEMVMWGQNRLRPLLWPGLLFQRLTVAMPGLAESRAGIAALEAALAEHARIERLTSAPAGAAQ